MNVVTACEQYSILSTLLVAADILQERHQIQPKKLYADVMMIICLESGQYWWVDVVIMFFYLSLNFTCIYKGNNLLKTVIIHGILFFFTRRVWVLLPLCDVDQKEYKLEQINLHPEPHDYRFISLDLDIQTAHHWYGILVAKSQMFLQKNNYP